MALMPTVMPPPGGQSMTPQGGGTAGGGGPAFTAGMTADQAQAVANQYLQQAGLPPDTGGMWGQYWTQFGQNDPNYFQTRLLNGMAQQGGNMTPWSSLQSSTAPGGWGQGTSGFGSAGNGGSGGGTTGGANGFQFDPNNLTNNPTLQFMTQQGINAIGANKAAMGTVLGTGTGKDYIDYAQQAASQFEPIAFNQAQSTFQTNFNNLGSLATGGENATNQQNQYTIGGANAAAGGTINEANAINNGLTAGQNQLQNQSLYNMFNPPPGGGGSSYASNQAQQTANTVYGYG